MDYVMAWVDDTRHDREARFTRWKELVGRKWTPSAVAVKCCPFWLENGWHFEFELECEMADWEVHYGEQGCGCTRVLHREAAAANAGTAPPPDRCAKDSARGRRYRYGVPFQTSVEHPVITLRFRVDDDTETSVTEAVLSHALDPFKATCAKAGGVQAPDDGGKLVFSWANTFIRDVQKALSKARLSDHLVYVPAAMRAASDQAWRDEEALVAAADVAEEDDGRGLGSLADFGGNTWVVINFVAMWVDFPTLYAMYRGSRLLRRAAVQAAQARLSSARFSVLLGYLGTHYTDVGFENAGYLHTSEPFLNSSDLNSNEDNVNVTTYTSHRFPLSFVQRVGWRARFEPPTGKSTVRWGETEVDDGSDAYGYGAPREAPYYIYEKLILYWHPGPHDGVECTRAVVGDAWDMKFRSSGGVPLTTQPHVGEVKKTGTIRSDGLLVEFELDTTASKTDDGNEAQQGSCTLHGVTVAWAKLLRIAGQQAARAMTSKADAGPLSQHDLEYQRTVLEPLGQDKPKK